MNKITSLHEANEYLKDVALYLWQKENAIHCASWEGDGPVIQLRFPEVEPCKSMADALQRLNGYNDRMYANKKDYKNLTEEQRETVHAFWQKERESYKGFNAIVQGWYPPHQ